MRGALEVAVEGIGDGEKGGLLGERGLRSHVVGWDCPSRRAGSGWVHGVEHVWSLEERDRGPGTGRLAPSDAGDVLAGIAGRGNQLLH